MRSLRRVFVSTLVPLWIAAATATARAQEPGALESSDGIDDPKVARRLGARIDLAAPPAETTELALAASPEAVVPATVGRPGGSRTPRLKVAYRRFNFAQIGPMAPSTAAGASEAFNVVSLDLYPISSSIRFGLSTQYGWEDGTFRKNGDAFIAESLSLGWQSPGPALTPFIEGYAGGGLLQRTHPELNLNSIATAYGQLGVDVGAEVFLARFFFMSFAVGYLHGADWFARSKVVGSFSVDTWSFKLGMGL